MNAKTLADRILNCEVGSRLYDNHIAFPDDNHWMIDATFINDGRTVLAMMSLALHHISLVDLMRNVVNKADPGESLGPAILEACCAAIEGNGDE